MPKFQQQHLQGIHKLTATLKNSSTRHTRQNFLTNDLNTQGAKEKLGKKKTKRNQENNVETKRISIKRW